MKNMHVSIKRTFSFLALVLLLNLSITACGSSSASSTNSMTLRVTQDTTSATYFPLYVAQQENFFKAQGLTLDPATPPPLGNGTKVTAAIEANSFDLAGGTITDAFTVSRVDAQIKILGAYTNSFLIDVVASKRFEQQTHLTEASPLVDKVKALVGKKIGISAPGSATESLLVYLFRQFGYDTKHDATLVNLGNVTPAAGLAALSNGRIDALSFPVPAGQEAKVHNVGDTFISPLNGDVPELQGMPYGLLFARQSVIDAKPKAIQAFIHAMAQTEDFMRKNPSQTTTLLAKYLQLDQKTTAALATTLLPSYAANPRIDQKGYDEANQFHVKAGLIAIALAYKDMVATDTINTALSGS